MLSGEVFAHLLTASTHFEEMRLRVFESIQCSHLSALTVEGKRLMLLRLDPIGSHQQPQQHPSLPIPGF